MPSPLLSSQPRHSRRPLSLHRCPACLPSSSACTLRSLNPLSLRHPYAFRSSPSLPRSPPSTKAPPSMTLSALTSKPCGCPPPYLPSLAQALLLSHSNNTLLSLSCGWPRVKRSALTLTQPSLLFLCFLPPPSP